MVSTILMMYKTLIWCILPARENACSRAWIQRSSLWILLQVQPRYLARGSSAKWPQATRTLRSTTKLPRTPITMCKRSQRDESLCFSYPHAPAPASLAAGPGRTHGHCTAADRSWWPGQTSPGLCLELLSRRPLNFPSEQKYSVAAEVRRRRKHHMIEILGCERSGWSGSEGTSALFHLYCWEPALRNQKRNPFPNRSLSLHWWMCMNWENFRLKKSYNKLNSQTFCFGISSLKTTFP